MRKKGVAGSDFNPARPTPLTRKQKAALKAIAALPDESIDTSDIPPLSEEFWATAERGKLYRPVKQQLILRLDADLVDWFKRRARDGRGYQTDINRALREYMRQHDREGTDA